MPENSGSGMRPGGGGPGGNGSAAVARRSDLKTEAGETLGSM